MNADHTVTSYVVIDDRLQAVDQSHNSRAMISFNGLAQFHLDHQTHDPVRKTGAGIYIRKQDSNRNACADNVLS